MRVVELIEHPAGDNGLVLLVEFVHSRCWSENTRFVVLEVYDLCQALNPIYTASGHVDSLEDDKAAEKSAAIVKTSQQIHILDEKVLLVLRYTLL